MKQFIFVQPHIKKILNSQEASKGKAAWIKCFSKGIIGQSQVFTSDAHLNNLKNAFENLWKIEANMTSRYSGLITSKYFKVIFALL